MIGYTILLLGCSGVVLANAPPYVESSEAFVYAKTLIGEKLPNRKMDIHNLQDRSHLSFAMLTGVSGGLVLLQNQSVHVYTPLEVVGIYVPLIWNSYDRVMKKTLNLINDATNKVRVIVDLINNICGSVSVAECNALVDGRVKSSPFIYERPANLLLSLGKVSVAIRDNESTINSITKNDNDIPYLIHNVENPHFLTFISLLRDVYTTLSELTYRRLLGDSDI